MKLYKHYHRLKWRKFLPKRQERFLRWALTLKPGDIINDCSGFNRVIREVYPAHLFNRRDGWAIYDVDFTTEPHGGGCSLFHCGVQPQQSRDELEKYYLSWIEKQKEDLLKKGWINKEGMVLIDKRIQIIKSGGHILDENGILLPEYDSVGARTL